MTIPLSDCRCVGAMTPPRASSSFDEASLVVTNGAGIYLRAETYLDDGLTGEEFSLEDWKLLVADGQATEQAFENLRLRTGTVLWVLRPNFSDRDSALDDLRASGALVAPIVLKPNTTTQSTDSWCLVARPAACTTELRDAWCKRAVSRAAELGSTGLWDAALAASEQAFALTQELNARVLGLLCLAYQYNDRIQRAQGYLQMAQLSKGLTFREEVEAHRVEWRRKLMSPTTPPLNMPGLARSPNPWKQERRSHLVDGQKALGRAAA